MLILTTQSFAYGLNDVMVDKIILIFWRSKRAAEIDVRPMLRRGIELWAKRRKMDLCCFCLFHERPDVMGSKSAARQNFDSVAGTNDQLADKFNPFWRGLLLAAGQNTGKAKTY